MQRTPDGLVFSPSDLIRFMESPFASWIKRFNLENPKQAIATDPEPEELRILQDRGIEHESAFLKSLEAEHGDIYVVDTEHKSREVLALETREAMEQGHEVIFQAFLQDGTFQGYADFLFKRPGPSNLGDYHYVPWDTKLARSVKPYFMIQLCCYAELLETQQGCLPEEVGVILGDNSEKQYRTRDFLYSYRAIKSEFMQQMKGDFGATKTPFMPEPGRDHKPFQALAEEMLIQADHPSQVAGITRSQTGKLAAAGIHTMGGLATTSVASVPRLNSAILERLKEQADLQVRSKGLEKPLFRVLPPPPDDPFRGLAQLPIPSALDVFFDMEGYPHVEDGLEYLFGATHLVDGTPVFLAFWAHSQADEKLAFEGFIDWVMDRFHADPSMHIYHYAPYEVTAMRKLMGKHATREQEVDTLLRNDVFIDLYRVVREGLRVGEPSYSIKNLENLYWQKREGDVQDAGASIVQYHNWMQSGESADIAQSPILAAIHSYNKDDCDSTLALCEWLRDQAKKHGFKPLVPPPASAPSASPEISEEAQERLALLENMLGPMRDPPGGDSEEDARVHELLTQLLEFHRREEKPIWWRMFDWMSKTPLELYDDSECIALLTRTAQPPVPIKRSTGFHYQFEPGQDTKLRGSSAVRLHDQDGAKGTIEFLDLEKGELLLKLGKAALDKIGDAPSTLSLFPYEPTMPSTVRDALYEVVANYWNGAGLPAALEQFLFRGSPGPMKNTEMARKPGHSASQWAVELATRLNGDTLCVQGPPGTGKTYTGAHMILALVQAGKKVAVTSNSHKAILNLCSATLLAARESNLQVSCFKAGRSAKDPFFSAFPEASLCEPGEVGFQLQKGAELVGATAWTLARHELIGAFDVLFIDEAGQFSLANMVGISRCAKNLVLLGDQQQLSQPIQGSHPGETGLSCLDYLLWGHAIVPSNLGVFLDRTWRMHPELCQFVSEAFYENRLSHESLTANRHLLPGAPDNRVRLGAGIQLVEVEHEGNTVSSPEEVEMVARLVDNLLKLEHTNEAGETIGALTLDDILIVAPFNLQVHALISALPQGTKIGTVDKFQGQEAKVVIVSMTASDPNESTRGIEFLFEPNRINVALSRAQSLALVVASPRLGLPATQSISKLLLSNLFCRLAQECKEPEEESPE